MHNKCMRTVRVSTYYTSYAMFKLIIKHRENHLEELSFDEILLRVFIAAVLCTSHNRFNVDFVSR